MSSSSESFNNKRKGLSEEGYELYRKYCALKAHFKHGSKYDYFKSNGAISATRSSYAKRHDAPFFTSLAKTTKHADEVLLSNILYDPNTWIGDIETEKINSIYHAWKQRTDRIEHNFASDVNSLKIDFRSNFVLDKEGNYPYILEKVIDSDINFETFSIFVNLFSLNTLWADKLSDTILAPKVIERAVKYHPFLLYNRDRLKKIIKDHWEKH